MGKLIVLIALVIIVALAIKRALQPPPSSVGKTPAVEGELVACAHCGVHLPRSEARAAGGALYCSEEHARLGRAAR